MATTWSAASASRLPRTNRRRRRHLDREKASWVLGIPAPRPALPRVDRSRRGRRPRCRSPRRSRWRRTAASAGTRRRAPDSPRRGAQLRRSSRPARAPRRASRRRSTSRPRVSGPSPWTESSTASASRSAAGTPAASRRAKAPDSSFRPSGPPAPTPEHRQTASATGGRLEGGRHLAASSRCSISTASLSPRSATVRATRSSRSVPRPGQPLGVGEVGQPPRRDRTQARDRAERSTAEARVQPAAEARLLLAACRRDPLRNHVPSLRAPLPPPSPRPSSAQGSPRRRSGRGAAPRCGRRSVPGTPGVHWHAILISGVAAGTRVRGRDELEPRRQDGRARARATIVTRPSSSGWRSASRTSRENSVSSSRKSTPPSARVTSPGREPAARRPRWLRTSSCGAAPGTAAFGRARAAGPRRTPTPRSSPPATASSDERRQERRDRPREHRLARSRAARSSAAHARPRGPPRAPAAPRAGRGRRRGPGPAAVRPAPGPRAPSTRSRAGRELDARRRRSAPRRRRERRRPTASATVAAATISRPSTSARLIGAVGRDDDPLDAAPRERRDHRQQPGNGPNLAAERHLADERGPAGASGELLRSDQDPDGDREIRRGAGLGHVGGREVDRDPTRRMDEAGVPERAANAFARLANRGVAEPDDRESRQPRRDVDLDPDDPAVQSDERCGEQGREHVATLRTAAYRRLTSAARSFGSAQRALAAPARAGAAPATAGDLRRERGVDRLRELDDLLAERGVRLRVRER